MSNVAPPPHRPPLVRALNAFGRVADRFGVDVPSLELHGLEAAARARTGLEDFGDADHREGLERLLDSLEGDAKLNFLGRVSARSQIVDLLSIRLELTAYRKAHPELEAERIERPLFILGLPRTGTTLLYELLALDPAHRTPVSWELARPCPPPERARFTTDPRIAPIEKNLSQFKKMVPNIDAIHPIGATLPQECIVAMAPSFRSFQFQLSFGVSSYHRWYMQADLAPAYRFHRRFLAHLQSRHRGDRWVLKSPAHLGHLDALLDEYPDARIVQTHRDPVDVIPSVSSLHYTLRGFGSDAVDPRTVGAEQSALWSEFLARAIDTRRRRHFAGERILDVRFADVLADPIGVVSRIYAHFGLPLDAATLDTMRRYLSANPREKHGKHRYTPEMFGLTADGIRNDFRVYRAQFGFESSYGTKGMDA